MWWKKTSLAFFDGHVIWSSLIWSFFIALIVCMCNTAKSWISLFGNVLLSFFIFSVVCTLCGFMSRRNQEFSELKWIKKVAKKISTGRETLLWFFNNRVQFIPFVRPWERSPSMLVWEKPTREMFFVEFRINYTQFVSISIIWSILSIWSGR